MKRRILPALLVGFALAGGFGAHAREGNTMQDELRIYTDDIAKQCASVKDQLKDFKVNADPLTGYTLKDAVQSLCVCIPNHVQAMASTLTPEELARPVSAEDALNRFNYAVIDKCAGEQMQSMYGEKCPNRFKKADLDVPKYCSCMKEVVSSYTDAEAAAIAAAASDYLPAAAEAEKKGEPAPPRPPILEVYYKADSGCKGMRKQFENLKP